MSFEDSTMGESNSDSLSDRFSNQIELTGNDPTDTNRKRIRVACDSCRRKKIKCNGTYPCTNCVQSKDESNCHYTDRPVKKPKALKEKKVRKEPKKKKPPVVLITSNSQPNNNNATGNVESRLSAIESSILRMMNVMERILGRLNGDGGHGYSEDDRDHEDDHESRGRTRTPAYLEDPKKGDNADLVKLRNWDEFVGTHSISCIFSKDSLGWMERSLGECGVEYITPIRNLPLVFFSELKPYILKWVDPPVVDKYQRRKLLEHPFPNDEKLINGLVNLYYEETNIINTIVDESWLRGLFTSYFNNFKETNEKKKRRFKLAELLSMTCVLLIALTCGAESVGIHVDPIKFPDMYSEAAAMLDGYSRTMLTELQETLFDSAIYYYQRVAVVSEGIETIEALLLLIVCIESDWLTSFFNHIPIAVVIRYAQDLGLHRAESYANLPLKEQERRRRVWWFCYFFDIEFCFKSGKPPMINSNDVTTNSDEDLLQYFKKQASEAPQASAMPSVFQTIIDEVLNSNTAPMSMSLSILRQIQYGGYVNNPLYYHFSLLLLSKIRSQSYHELFVALVQKRSFNEISNTLEKLNAEMMELAAHSADAIRPRFHNDPAFQVFDSEKSLSRKESIMSFKLSFFCHLMIINRYPFMIVTKDSLLDDRILQYRNISLDSARTILLLIKQWGREEATSFFMNWAVYFPVAAFLVLSAAILNHPLFEESQRDLHLLIDIALSHFSRSKDWKNSHPLTTKEKNVYVSKALSLELIIRLMLRVVIRVFENQTGIPILEGNEMLKDYLQEAETKFPEIFQNHEQFTSQMVQVVGASPFGSSGDEYANRRTGVSPRTGSTYSAKSPSYNPSLKNIINSDVNSAPNGIGNGNGNGAGSVTHSTNSPINGAKFQPGAGTAATNGGFPVQGYDLLNEYLESDVSSLPFGQFDNLPNFFFDNNLGV
ncbi:Halotolerance protein 9 [Candida viswanathii]|uniref:Halotolerance protein 9 n=1 Tax=Candida viswanathii TaxID=5486 RepID=A0A367YJP2_9ASCO|nr:Halotolerance protein 9 [Candida viswanathii]